MWILIKLQSGILSTPPILNILDPLQNDNLNGMKKWKTWKVKILSIQEPPEWASWLRQEKTTYVKITEEVKQRLQIMKDSWLLTKVEEIQWFADINDSKHFLNAVKSICEQQQSGSALPLLYANDSYTMTEKEEIIE